MNTTAQPWVHSRIFDCAFILAPAWIIAITLLLFPQLVAVEATLSPLTWLLAIVCIDVAHVYATLYRTYFDRHELRTRPGLYIGAPLVGFGLSVLLYSQSAPAFWTALAYLAVFHFVRQQYGLLMLYSRTERSSPAWMRHLDQTTIYAATLYPLVYWHTHLPAQFHWFVAGDFLALPSGMHTPAAFLYVACLSAYYAKELWQVARSRNFNWPRNLLVGGTIASWYVGIVMARGDLGFTLANVIAHGIPYVALIWIFSVNRQARAGRSAKFFAPQALSIFVGILLLLAYAEEALWDGLIWREHLSLFGWASGLPAISSHAVLSLLIPALALPQITHYILDGFIWRLQHNADWRHTLFHRGPAITVK